MRIIENEMEMLEWHLAAYGTEHITQTPPMLLTHYEYAMKGQLSFMEDCLYIIRAQDAWEWDTLSNAGNFLVLGCAADSIAERLGPETNITTVMHTENLTAIFEALEGFFLGMRRAVDVTSLLMVALEFGYSLQQIADIISKGFGNPIAVSRIPSEVLTVAQGEGLSKDEVYSLSFVSLEELADIADNLAYPTVFTAERGIRFISAGIMTRGATTYLLQTFEDRRPFDSGDRSFVHCMCVFLRYFLRSQQAIEAADTPEAVLRDVVFKHETDEERILRRASATHLLPRKGSSRLLMFYPASGLGSARELSQLLSEIHELTGHAAIFANQDVVSICDESRLGDVNAFLTSHMRLGLTCACSLPVRSATMLRRAFRQCRSALRMASDSKDQGAFLRYEDLAMRDLLIHASTQMDLGRFVHLGVRDMVEADAADGSEYAQTLRAYLEHGQRINETAKALNVHRNTVIYRFERIRELFGIDVQDDHDMEAARLSLLILDILGLRWI